MMRRLSTAGLFAAALGVAVLTDSVVLAGFAYNRAGTPEARLMPTEREMPTSCRPSRENSGLPWIN